MKFCQFIILARWLNIIHMYNVNFIYKASQDFCLVSSYYLASQHYQ